MSERYRDASPKCERFIPPPSHFLANSTPMASTDNYSYISSTVHTPVKRYIPTPPPQTESYDNGYLQQQQMSRSHSSQSQQHQQIQHQPQQNTLPYRFRMKCCQNDQSVANNNLKQLNDITDHYATPPRVRPIKCSSTSSNTITTVSVPSQTSSSSNYNRQSRQICSNNNNNNVQEFNQRSQSSMDYSNMGRVSTPINNTLNDSSSLLSNNSNSNACLHCNTIRRTTGVHQTTQTTGPISPIPQQLSSCDVSDRQSPISPPSTSSSLSTTPSPLPQQPIQSPTQSQQQLNNDSPPSNFYSKQQHQQIILKYQTQQQLQSQGQTLESNPALSKNNDNGSSVSCNSNVTMQHVAAPPQLSTQSISAQPPALQPIPRQNNNININTCNNNINGNNNNNININNNISQRLTRKQRLKEYLKKETAKFFGVDTSSEEQERLKWNERQKRFALRRFGQLKDDNDIINNINSQNAQQRREQQGDRPDILPAQSTDETATRRHHEQLLNQYKIERKSSVPTMMWNGLTYIVQTMSKKRIRKCKQWSRSFAPSLVALNDNDIDACDGLTPINDDETFFESTNTSSNSGGVNNIGVPNNNNSPNARQTLENLNQQLYIGGERIINGWRTKSSELHLQQQGTGYRSSMRISSQLLDGVMDNSR